ncbi:MAG: phosphotransferase [Caldilineaceae bacterium]
MMPLNPTMLWEATDPGAALLKRFRFASGAEAGAWLVTVLADVYGIEVVTVDRLVISAYNLLAWLTTTNGLFLAKCCSDDSAHERLVNVADLLGWLAQAQLPVSLPLLARTGARQVRRDHLSIVVQRLISGELLDPAQAVQTQAAGVTLARFHRALDAYPCGTEFGISSAVLPLAETIAVSARRCKRQGGVPSLLIGIETLLRWVEQHQLPMLTPQLIHHDYRAANILWHAGKIAAVLDFDDVCWGYRVNDLAWSAVHLGTRYHHWGTVSEEVHDTFLAAYTSQHPLTEVEQAWLPRLMLWHSINLAGSAVGGENFEAAVESVVTYTCRLDSPDGI